MNINIRTLRHCDCAGTRHWLLIFAPEADYLGRILHNINIAVKC